MFCIFPAISLPRAFTFEATEKGLRHFSFSDVFRTFRNLGACLPIRKLHFLMSAIYFRVIIMAEFWFAVSRGLCGRITLSCLATFS